MFNIKLEIKAKVLKIHDPGANPLNGAEEQVINVLVHVIIFSRIFKLTSV